MDALEMVFGLAGLAVLVMPILLIVALVKVSGLGRRVNQLEAQVKFLLASGAEKAAEGAPVAEASVPEAPEVAAPEVESPEPEQAQPVEPAPVAADAPPKAVVLKASNFDRLRGWATRNWIYVISGLSLALAGLFLAQYGIERGLLPPVMRVGLALAFGAALIVAGEYVRRRFGDGEEAVSAYIPSIFSGAGVVTLFGAILSAFHLYALIPQFMAFAGLVLVAAVALVLGWFTGPLLAAIGVIGAFGAPFVVSTGSGANILLLIYFATIALVGLGIDTVRRWAWVSVLTLALAVPAGVLSAAAIPDLPALVLYMLALLAMTLTIPMRSLWPNHGGSTVLEAVALGRPLGWPEFPTRLVAGLLPFALFFMLGVGVGGESEFWIGYAGLTAALAMLALWAWRAEALEDLAVLPALALVAAPVIAVLNGLEVFDDYRALLERAEGVPAPVTPQVFFGFAIAATLIAAARSWWGGRWPVYWAFGAALMVPAIVAALEIFWTPAAFIGTYRWAIMAMVGAALTTALTVAFARRDGDAGLRAGYFALAAIGLITFSLSILLSHSALTLAFAVMTVGAAALDRRFAMPALGLAVQAGAAALTYRLVIDPGLGVAIDGTMLETLLSYGGATAAMAACIWLLKPLDRPRTKLVAESAAWSFAALFATALILQVARALGQDSFDGHGYVGLMASVWLISAANQLWRTKAPSRANPVRIILATVYGAIALLLLAVNVTVLNPLGGRIFGYGVVGPPFLNSMLPGYLLPAVIMGLVAQRFTFLKRGLRISIGTGAAALGALWLFLAIRHFWRGAAIASSTYTAPELYSYTIVLILVGVGLIFRSFTRRSQFLRRAGLAVILAAVAKVFFIDISGLGGLFRIFSLLALGLSLAGLAAFDRWAQNRFGPPEEPPADPPKDSPKDPEEAPNAKPPPSS